MPRACSAVAHNKNGNSSAYGLMNLLELFPYAWFSKLASLLSPSMDPIVTHTTCTCVILVSDTKQEMTSLTLSVHGLPVFPRDQAQPEKEKNNFYRS